MSQKAMVRSVVAVMFALGALASAVAQMPNPYGPAISLEEAKKAAAPALAEAAKNRSEEHTSELQSLAYLVCRLLLEKKKKTNKIQQSIKKRYTSLRTDN